MATTENRGAIEADTCRPVRGTRGSEGDGDGFLFTGQGVRAWKCEAGYIAKQISVGL
jgi:hypothetical protein